MKENKMNQQFLIKRTLLTGFIGGIILYIMSQWLYIFNFSKVNLKSYIWSEEIIIGAVARWISHLFIILLIGAISMLLAWIYYIVFRKIYSFWLGILYGVFLWVIFLFVLNPLSVSIMTVLQDELNTIASTLALFLVYGIFIGYSISYDYYDTITSAKDSHLKNDV